MEDSIACLYPLPQGKKSHALQAVESSRNSSRLVDVEDDLPELHGRNSRESRAGKCGRTCERARTCKRATIIPCTVPYAHAQAHVTQTSLAIAGLIFRISFTFPSK